MVNIEFMFCFRVVTHRVSNWRSHKVGWYHFGGRLPPPAENKSAGFAMTWAFGWRGFSPPHPVSRYIGRCLLSEVFMQTRKYFGKGNYPAIRQWYADSHGFNRFTRIVLIFYVHAQLITQLQKGALSAQSAQHLPPAMEVSFRILGIGTGQQYQSWSWPPGKRSHYFAPV